MKIIIPLASLIFLFSACAGGSYSARKTGDGFYPSVCSNIPFGVEKFQYIDPSLKHLKISCADVARCAALYGQGTPSNVPCK